MKIFITGASGFVGGAATRALASEHTILAMSRSEASDAKIRALGAEPIRTALNEVRPEHLDGCDAIIHAAAHVEEWGPWEEFQRITVDGTRQLLEVAKGAGVRRFIHIGSEAALFAGQALVDIDETAPLALDSPFPYPRSKALSEQAVIADSGDGLETIVLRPRMIWGENDQTILPEVLKLHAEGKFAWIDGGQMLTSTTHIDNLVHAIRLALTKGRPGEAYFITDGPPVHFRSFMSRYAAAVGTNLGTRSVPGWLMRSAASVIEPLWSLFRPNAKPPVTRYLAALMSQDCTLKGKKAGKDLGYTPVISLDAALARLETVKAA